MPYWLATAPGRGWARAGVLIRKRNGFSNSRPPLHANAPVAIPFQGCTVSAHRPPRLSARAAGNTRARWVVPVPARCCSGSGTLSQRRVAGRRECVGDMSPPMDLRRSRAGHPTVAVRRPPASEPSSAEALSAPFGWRMAATLRDTCTGPQRNIAQHWLQPSPYLTPHRCGLLVIPGGSCFQQ